jgi:hypothetical protein
MGIQDHSRSAITALEGVVFDEGFLQGMKTFPRGQAFDGYHTLSGNLPDRDLAGALGLFIDENRARSAEALAAGVFGTREV